MDSVADVWKWITDMDFTTELSGLAEHRSFEFTRSREGAVLLRAKRNMSDGDELYSNPVVLVPSIPSPLPALQYVIPRPVDVDKLATMALRLTKRLSGPAQL